MSDDFGLWGLFHKTFSFLNDVTNILEYTISSRAFAASDVAIKFMVCDPHLMCFDNPRFRNSREMIASESAYSLLFEFAPYSLFSSGGSPYSSHSEECDPNSLNAFTKLLALSVCF